jgi:hypothetical protein
VAATFAMFAPASMASVANWWRREWVVYAVVPMAAVSARNRDRAVL